MYSASLLAKFYCWQENEVASDTKGKVIDLRFQRISEHKGRRKFEKTCLNTFEMSVAQFALGIWKSLTWFDSLIELSSQFSTLTQLPQNG